MVVCGMSRSGRVRGRHTPVRASGGGGEVFQFFGYDGW